MRFSAIILAAGSGHRAGEAKQWRMLGDEPVLLWSVRRLAAAGAERLVVAVPPGDLDRAAALLAPWSEARVVAGGVTRVDSTRAALAVLDRDAHEAVLIHDAARPFVPASVVERLLDALAEADGAVPVIAVADTLKRADATGALATVDRSGLSRAQTPQAFRLAILRRAFEAADEAATDDAELVARAGGRVVAVAGDPMLMKLTWREDFTMAEALAAAQAETRIGFGYDVHRFGDGDHVWLCGVRIAHEHGLVGHSDADAGLHALTDALLGAIGQGDIGEHFPPSDAQWKGVSSDRFVAHAVDRLHQAGGRVINADITLICETPKIGPHRQAMRERVAALLHVPVHRVGVKATTTEGLGFTGRREGLAAQAVVGVSLPGRQPISPRTTAAHG